MNHFPMISRLRKNFARYFWNNAIKELERKLNNPNKTLEWKEKKLDDQLQSLSEKISVVHKIPTSLEKGRKVVHRRPIYIEKILHPMKTRSQTRKQKKNMIAAALDPGVRTFQTLYDTDNNIIEFGIGDVYQFCLDKKGLKEKIRDIHYSLGETLVKRYGLIMIPRLDIVSDDKYLAIWDHSKFVDRLFSVARKTGTRVVEVDEIYTSKTCSSCGEMSDPGRSKTFKCTFCGLIIDRDQNAARNILLKSMDRLGLDIEK